MKKLLLAISLFFSPLQIQAICLPTIPEKLFLPAHWLIAAGLPFYHAAQDAYRLLSKKEQYKEFGQEIASEKAHTFVRSVLKEMDMPKSDTVSIHWAKTDTISPGSIDIQSIGNTLYINKELFEACPESYMRFLIGCEAKKINNKDSYKHVIVRALLPFITRYGIQKYTHLTNKLRAWLAVDEHSYSAKLFNAHEWVANTAVAQLIITSIAYSWFCQYQEKNADIASAIKLHAAQEGLTIFESLYEMYGNKTSIFLRFKPNLKNRINYLKLLAKKQTGSLT